MRAWIFSDLHLETDPEFAFADVPRADVCICAGDVMDGGVSATIQWLGKVVAPKMPVVLVAGNHEYYRSSIREGLAMARELAQCAEGVFLLEGDAAIIGGYRFIGTTLWTDFSLHGDARLAMAIARDELNDFKRIKLSKTPYKRFGPQDSRSLHRQATEEIDNIHLSLVDLPTVIVSHHAPSLLSVPEVLRDDSLTPAFASHLESRILAYQPILWVHGHIHHPCDYIVGKTRVICNPLGYPGEPCRQTFNPRMVIDLEELVGR